MQKERILLDQNDSLLNDICSDLKHFKPLLNNLKTIYESLELGAFTHQIYEEIVHSGAEGICKIFKASIESDIEKMGVSKSIIKDNIISGSDDLLNQFTTYVTELKRFRPDTFSRQKKLSLKHISFNEKGFVITPDDKENILESQCRIYLETDEEHTIYEDLTKFITAFEVVEKYITNNGISMNQMASKMSYIETYFLNRNGEKLEIKPDMIKWIVSRKAMF
jgi:hypothetical protein